MGLIKSPIFAALALAALSAVMILPGLGDRYLWDDEAETALLARNVLRYGLPFAYDGRNIISQESGIDYGPDYLWKQTPWLPIYIAAASFKILGISTWTARLPFALLGIACVPSFLLLARRVFRDRTMVALAVLGLLACIPFLVHARQCRYYSTVLFASIWTLYFLDALYRGERRGIPGLVVALTLLFHANYLHFLAGVTGLVVATLAIRPGKKVLVHLSVVLAATLILNIFWVFQYGLMDKGTSAMSSSTPSALFLRMLSCLIKVDMYLLPAPLLAAFLVLMFTRRNARFLHPSETRLALFLLVMILSYVVMISAPSFLHFRYLLGMLPAIILLQALVLGFILRKSRMVGVVVISLTLLTDLFSAWSPYCIGAISTLERKVRYPLFNYYWEITHPYQGPIETIVRFLKVAGRPSDRLFITYGDLPFRFYTHLEVRGGLSGQRLDDWPMPDWIMIRPGFRPLPRSRAAIDDYLRVSHYLHKQVPWSQYRRIELPCVDTLWENIPEPEAHIFIPPRDGPVLTIFQRVGDTHTPSLQLQNR